MTTANIIIATHGNFAEALLESAQMIAGKMDMVTCCSLLPSYSFEDYMHKAENMLAKKEGIVFVLADLYGGTPCNVFSALSRKYHHHIITGLNMPLLIDLYLKLSNCDTLNEEKLISECIETVCTSCIYVNAKLDT